MEKRSLFARVGFEVLMFVVAMVAFVAEMIILVAVLSAFGFSPDAFKHFGGALVVLNLVLGRIGADRILKAFGYSGSGRTHET